MYMVESASVDGYAYVIARVRVHVSELASDFVFVVWCGVRLNLSIFELVSIFYLWCGVVWCVVQRGSHKRIYFVFLYLRWGS